MTDPVASVTPLGEEDVFDLTERATSHFVANGLTIHNCSEYSFLNDTSCNLASLNLMTFVGEDGELDVDDFRLRLPPDDHGPGDPRRQRQLPDAEDRGEQPPLPAARPGLRQPRRAAHEPRPGLRLAGRAGLRRRDHLDHDRRGLPPERRHRPRPRRPVHRVREEPRAVPGRHRQAPRGGHAHPHGGRAGRRLAPPPATCGTRPTRSASSTATATRRPPCSRQPAPSRS